MKIANITCVYPPYKGGMGTAAKEFADLMSEAGHEVVTFLPDYGNSHHPCRTTPSPFPRQTRDRLLERRGDLLRECPRGGEGGWEKKIIRLKPFLKFGNAAFLPQFFWCLKDFDIIYLNYPFFGAQEVLWLALKIFYPKKKFIIRYHMDVVGKGIVFKIFSLPLKIIFTSFFKRANLIITASLDYVQHGDLANVYQKNSEKFAEVPYGVNAEKFKPLSACHCEEKVLSVSDKMTTKQSQAIFVKNEIVSPCSVSLATTFNILFVGGLDKAHYFKGVDVLLKAVAKLPLLIKYPPPARGGAMGGGREDIKNGQNEKSFFDWRLSIIGHGELKSKYEKMAKDLGIIEKVSFLDKVGADELPSFYQKSDVLVLPSINKCEAFGIALIESMACGTPVIASDLPGVRGVFIDGMSGLKVIPGDVNDLMEKIKYLINNPVKQKQMREAARILVEKKYLQKKIKEKLIHLFN